jgi:hypothetical protein
MALPLQLALPSVSLQLHQQESITKQAWVDSSPAELSAPSPQQLVHTRSAAHRNGSMRLPLMESTTAEPVGGDTVRSIAIVSNHSCTTASKLKHLTPRTFTAGASRRFAIVLHPLSYRVGTDAVLRSIHADAQLEIQRPASPSLLDNYFEIITQIGCQFRMTLSRRRRCAA